MKGILHHVLTCSPLLSPAHSLPGPHPPSHAPAPHIPHPPDHCPPFPNGTFTIHQWQLYPENGFWDSHRCLLYLTALFNGTVVVFDPYTNTTLDTFSFPGISDQPDEHGSGLHWDSRTGDIWAVIDAQPAFLTNGANVSGDYWLVRFDPRARREVWRANLTSLTNAQWGGFQDVTLDAHGNAYVIGTYPKSIAKVPPSGGPLSAWYPPQGTNTSVHGYTGVASTGDILLVVDNMDVPEQSTQGASEIYRFDMRDGAGTPALVARTPHTPLDVSVAIHLPKRYGGTVLLVAQDLRGVAVLRSRDGAWREAEHLGTVESSFPEWPLKILPATVQIGQSQFVIGQYFPGELVEGTKAGNRSDFPMFDITAEVEKLLAG